MVVGNLDDDLIADSPFGQGHQCWFTGLTLAFNQVTFPITKALTVINSVWSFINRSTSQTLIFTRVVVTIGLYMAPQLGWQVDILNV